jgi:hypothetical protein
MIRTTQLLAMLVFSFGPLAGAGEAALGSADFRPTAERPSGWRGDGSGRFPGATPVTTWSAEKNVRWSAVVGRGYSSPIIAGDSVIVTSEPNLVICLDRANGKERWRAEVTTAELADSKQREEAQAYVPPKDGSGMAAATPVTDGTNVYAAFANGHRLGGRPGSGQAQVAGVHRRATEHRVRTKRLADHRRRAIDRSHDEPVRLRLDEWEAGMGRRGREVLVRHTRSR